LICAEALDDVLHNLIAGVRLASKSGSWRHATVTCDVLAAMQSMHLQLMLAFDVQQLESALEVSQTLADTIIGIT
jgi:hypothetical protein